MYSVDYIHTCSAREGAGPFVSRRAELVIYTPRFFQGSSAGIES